MAAVGVVVGGLTLAGAPLTIGFALRWQLLQALSQVSMTWPLFITIAGIGVTIGYLRGLYTFLPTANPTQSSSPMDSKEPRLLVIIILLLCVACLALGLFPEWLLEPLREAVGGITVPI